MSVDGVTALEARIVMDFCKARLRLQVNGILPTRIKGSSNHENLFQPNRTGTSVVIGFSRYERPNRGC